ncbi:MAG: hypothetical protein HYT70_00360 [Candidatus Aenigmarchaeota archaeon]|nr:hypothetical protein [Candidatus Aenigmarchaeota archaeon]
MSIVTVFKFDGLSDPWQVAKLLNKHKKDDFWLTAFVSKYNRNEVVVNYMFYEDVEEGIKRVFDENESIEIVSYLKQNGKSRVLKRVYCFINLMMKTLEVYTGSETKLNEIVATFEEVLKARFTRVVVSPKELQTIYTNHSNELKQVMFKNVEGLFYEILRGKYLESNEKFKKYMEEFPESLRVISFRPRIKFWNGNNRYQVTLNGDKGTLRFSSPNEEFDFRPRIEIRQLTFLIAATLGFLG